MVFNAVQESTTVSIGRVVASLSETFILKYQKGAGILTGSNSVHNQSLLLRVILNKYKSIYFLIHAKNLYIRKYVRVLSLCLKVRASFLF
jgi:hypothetical protein